MPAKQVLQRDASSILGAPSTNSLTHVQHVNAVSGQRDSADYLPYAIAAIAALLSIAQVQVGGRWTEAVALRVPHQGSAVASVQRVAAVPSVRLPVLTGAAVYAWAGGSLAGVAEHVLGEYAAVKLIATDDFRPRLPPCVSPRLSCL